MSGSQLILISIPMKVGDSSEICTIKQTDRWTGWRAGGRTDGQVGRQEDRQEIRELLYPSYNITCIARLNSS